LHLPSHALLLLLCSRWGWLGLLLHLLLTLLALLLLLPHHTSRSCHASRPHLHCWLAGSTHSLLSHHLTLHSLHA
jgi:hypothetical protein